MNEQYQSYNTLGYIYYAKNCSLIFHEIISIAIGQLQYINALSIYLYFYVSKSVLFLSKMVLFVWNMVVFLSKMVLFLSNIVSFLSKIVLFLSKIVSFVVSSFELFMYYDRALFCPFVY